LDSENQEPLPDGSLLAAIDLGSNSFHLIIAKIEHGEMRPVEALAEKVQLGAGLENGRLSEEAIERGLDCLSRFAQLLESVEPERIRVVGFGWPRIDATLPGPPGASWVPGSTWSTDGRRPAWSTSAWPIPSRTTPSRAW
jgi:hypothetical protein